MTTQTSGANVNKLSSLIWSIADILRSHFKQSEYGKIILPFVVLRRLDAILEPTKEAVLETIKSLPENLPDVVKDQMIQSIIGEDIKVYNLSQLTLKTIYGQKAEQIHANLIEYIRHFNTDVCDIFIDKFRLPEQLTKLEQKGILFQVLEKIIHADLHPDTVSNNEMGYLFEELIRKFSEISNETAGEHFTPREVIQLIVDLILVNDTKALTTPNIIRTVYDPACGTGGMLSITEQKLKGFNSKATVDLYGQEINDESYAICKSDMLISGHNASQIAFGNTLTHDAHTEGRGFHYIISNPPYGVDWKTYKDAIEHEHQNLGFDGRFGAGLPRVSDGQLLFLMHMISKMRNDEAGSRIGIVMNGSPLFTGGAGSGESEIRRWMLENDWIEAIIALPTDLFYNTGIQTYVWILTNRKQAQRVGKVQLINAGGKDFWQPMRKSLGSKRREISPKGIEQIVNLYQDFIADGEHSKIFDASEFGYREIRVERPLRLNFAIHAERLQRLKEDKTFLKLKEDEQKELLNALNTVAGTVFKNKEAFDKALQPALKGMRFKLSATMKKSLLTALSEKDETADVCCNADGTPEPDSEFRDHELVPLAEDYTTYVEREVMPFVPDAWVDIGHTDARDGKVGRVGYEINFNRYFYTYTPPRPVAEIDAEIQILEQEIANLLKEVGR